MRGLRDCSLLCLVRINFYNVTSGLNPQDPLPVTPKELCKTNQSTASPIPPCHHRECERAEHSTKAVSFMSHLPFLPAHENSRDCYLTFVCKEEALSSLSCIQTRALGGCVCVCFIVFSVCRKHRAKQKHDLKNSPWFKKTACVLYNSACDFV